jgi:hypothetical protein
MTYPSSELVPSKSNELRHPYVQGQWPAIRRHSICMQAKLDPDDSARCTVRTAPAHLLGKYDFCS